MTHINTDYPFANYQLVKVGKGKVIHAALHSRGMTRPDTVCGTVGWSSFPAELGEATDATCLRCLKSLPEIDKQNRRTSYAAQRDEELDALTWGADPKTATDWREAHYAKVASGKYYKA